MDKQQEKIILEEAARLGQKIRDDARTITLNVARKRFQENAELQRMISEWRKENNDLQEELKRTDRDTYMLDSLQTKLDGIWQEIVQDEDYKRLSDAEAEMNELMRRGHTPRVKPQKACRNCSMHDLCQPNLEKHGSVHDYVERMLREP